MKKYLLGVFTALLLFTSCSDNDETIVSIIGKWQLERYFDNEVEIDLSECSKKTTIDFFEDGAATENGYSEDTGSCESSTNSFTYEVVGSKLKITHPDNEIIETDIELTETTLTLSREDSEGSFIKGIWKKIN